jgi:hypothetical protein
LQRATKSNVHLFLKQGRDRLACGDDANEGVRGVTKNEMAGGGEVGKKQGKKRAVH